MAGFRVAALLLLGLLGHTACEEQDEDRCNGGSEEACSCLLSCPVFSGGSRDAVLECHGKSGSDLLEIVDDHVRKALQTPGAECDGISCVVECAGRLGCLDDKVQARCLNVVRDRPACSVDCSGAAATLPSVFALAAAAAALAAAAASD